MARRTAPDNHFGGFSARDLDVVRCALTSDVSMKLDDKMVVLLRGSPLAVIRGSLFELDTLKSVLMFWLPLTESTVWFVHPRWGVHGVRVYPQGLACLLGRLWIEAYLFGS